MAETRTGTNEAAKLRGKMRTRPKTLSDWLHAAIVEVALLTLSRALLSRT